MANGLTEPVEVADPIAAPLTIVVLSDTHLRDMSRRGGPARWLPDRVIESLGRASAILHAGDVVEAGVLARLRSYAPVHAVLGNNDRSLVGALPVTRTVDLAGVRIGMVHDSGRRSGRAARLRKMFPECDVVVFGHSHEPVTEVGVDGQLLFNPGSPTQRRRQPFATFGELELASGRIVARRIISLGD